VVWRSVASVRGVRGVTWPIRYAMTGDLYGPNVMAKTSGSRPDRAMQMSTCAAHQMEREREREREQGEQWSQRTCGGRRDIVYTRGEGREVR
jgi:hypothetical protein